MLNRLKNKFFLAALASIIYFVLQKVGVKLEQGMFRDIVDALAYLFLGVGVYSSYDAPNKPVE